MGWGEEHKPRDPDTLSRSYREAVAAWMERPSTGNEERVREAHRAVEQPIHSIPATRPAPKHWPRATCPGCGTEKAIIRGKFSVHDKWEDGVCLGLCPAADKPPA